MTQFVEAPSCTCDTCRDMCKRPCWGTPAEIRKIIDAGHAKKLMLDYWEVFEKSDEGYILDVSYVYLLCGANRGHERKIAPYWKGDSLCVFQNQLGLCTLHEDGLQPIEGRCAWHEPIKENRDLREWLVFSQWRTDEGRQLINEWKQLVGFND